MNRAERRAKKKDRRFTKKGYTRAIFVDDDRIAHNVPAIKGGRIDGLARHNAKKVRRTQARGS